MTNKYNIGDEVYLLLEKYNTDVIPCVTCEGLGNLKTVSGVEVKCAQCGGRGSTRHGYNTQEVLKYKIEIEAIAIIYNNICYTNYYDNSETKWFEEKDMFLTKEEAQAECDKRNEV
jgi:hypothetical protein